MNRRRAGLCPWMILAVACAASLGTGGARGDVISYEVMADTTGLAGTAGFLEFQFNPASAMSLLATATVSSFQTDGTLTTVSPNIGDATGTLPAPLSFDNATAFNDVFQGFTYGTSVSFVLTLSGPAVGTTPPGTLFGTTFAFFLEDSAANPLSNSPSGDAADFAINPDGSVTPTAFPPINPDGPTVTIQTAPEPSSLALAGLGLGILGLALRGRRSRRGGEVLSR